MTRSVRSYMYPGLPILNSLQDLSNRTHLSAGLLYKLSKRNNFYYRVFSIPKSSGEKREIAEPARPVKAIQSWILANILQQLPLLPQVTGFRRGYNILVNASAHQHNRYLLCLDIDDFFPSIKYPIVYTIYRKLGYNEHISHVLTSLCTFKGRLPQGGVTSPTLSNLSCFRLDRRISGYSGSRNIMYTRYADDMTFSSMSWERLVGLHKMVRQIVEEEGFSLNKAKSRYMGPKRRQKVTGLVIGDNQVGIGRQAERRLRATIYNICQEESSAERDTALTSLQGYLSFLFSVDPIRYHRTAKYIHRLSANFPDSDIKDKLQVKTD